MSVTPASLFVVAPAGYSFSATMPASRARRISSGGVRSVRYSVISGSKSAPVGQRLEDAARGSPAPVPCVVTGGFRLGMTMARANCRAVCGSTARMRIAVAQVQVPVVGAGQRQRRAHAELSPLCCSRHISA